VAELEEHAQLDLHGVARGDVHRRELTRELARKGFQVLRDALIQRLEHAARGVDVQIHLQSNILSICKSNTKDAECGVKQEVKALDVRKQSLMQHHIRKGSGPTAGTAAQASKMCAGTVVTSS
jgi:hypothetical protein